AFSFWSRSPLRLSLERTFGAFFGKKLTAQQKCCFWSRPAINDSLHLQSVLAARTLDLSAGLYSQDDSPRRLPRKIFTATRNLRWRRAKPAFQSTLNMAARSERRRSKHCVEARECVTRARTGFALRANYNHHDRVLVGAQNCAALGGSDVRAARLLADHAPRVFGDSSNTDCSY